MGVCSAPEEGRLAQGGRVSVSVVGSGHREAQLRPQALRGMLAPPVRGGRQVKKSHFSGILQINSVLG